MIHPCFLTPEQLAAHSDMRAHLALAVTAARKAGCARNVVVAQVLVAFDEAEKLERGAAAAQAAGIEAAHQGGDRRPPKRGERG